MSMGRWWGLIVFNSLVLSVFSCTDKTLQLPAPAQIDPPSASNTDSLDLTINGEHFYLSSTRKLGKRGSLQVDEQFKAELLQPGQEAIVLTAVVRLDSQTLQARLIGPIPIGVYDVRVVDPRGRVGEAAAVYQALPPDCERNSDCDDDNPCTDDSCAASGRCQFDPNNFSCDDGDACTEGDTCTAGTCTGSSLTCEDANPCTNDACDPALGCVFTDNFAPCEDGNPCTDLDACLNGTCQSGPNHCQCQTDADCTDEEDGDLCNGTLVCQASECAVDPATIVSCDSSGDTPCRRNECDPIGGSCRMVDLSDGTPCNDTDACTIATTCDQGFCTGTALGCDDGNPCSDDSCDPILGCQNIPADNICDDGNACTQNDFCAAGACGGDPINCADDSNPCTDSPCDPDIGCTLINVGGPCDDGDACTQSDICTDGECGGILIDCDDGIACTIDTCHNILGCQVSPNNNLCDDGNICSVDTCDALIGCQYVFPSRACDDGDACTQSDNCSAGVCVGSNPVDCSGLDDACNQGACIPATGLCQAQPFNENGACDNTDACTGPDTCTAGVCSGAPVICDDEIACTSDSCAVGVGCTFTANSGSCDDGDPCTDDSCDLLLGCQFTPNLDPCDDSNACTQNDACAAGSCTGDVVNCADDGNPCTDNPCDPGSGCTLINVGGPCDDGTVCTSSDTCSNGSCTGADVDCDDGFACTTDSCDAVIGCQYATDDAVCDDGDPCTDDSCQIGLGCQTTDNSAACEDGDLCTLNDFCQSGACMSGALADCSGLDNTCQVGRCDPATGFCVTDPINEGAACIPPPGPGIENCAYQCLSGACAEPPYARPAQLCNPADPRLGGCWTFDNDGPVNSAGGVIDNSGNNNHGTATALNYVAGLDALAVDFDGSGEIHVADSPSLDCSESMTIEAWVYPRSLPSSGRVGIVDNDGQYALFLYNSNRVRCSAGGFSYYATGPEEGEWSHVACLFDGPNNTIDIFINGQPVYSDIWTGTISTISSSDFTIGCNSPSGESIDGLIDTARLWCAPLDPDELCWTAVR